MRKYVNRFLCLFLKHEWVYQYRRVTGGNNSNEEYYIHKCKYCEKYKKFKK